MPSMSRRDDGVTGTISCQAGIIGTSTVTAGSATITVIGEPTTGIGPASLATAPAARFNTPLRMTVRGNRFVVPAAAAGGARMAVYDLRGKTALQHRGPAAAADRPRQDRLRRKRPCTLSGSAENKPTPALTVKTKDRPPVAGSMAVLLHCNAPLYGGAVRAP